MKTEITELVDRLKHELARVEGLANSAPATATCPTPRYTVSNFKLLLKTINGFYGRSPSAPYLPNRITVGVKDRLANLEGLLGNIKTGADDPEAANASGLLPNLLEQMDDAYAFCLQYAIISFGFSARVAQEQVNIVQACVADVETEKAASLAKLAEAVKSVEGFVEEGQQHAATAKAAADAASKELGLVRAAKADVDALQKAVTEKRDLVDADADTVAEALSNAQSHEKLAAASAASAKTSNTEAGEAKTDVEGRRAAINKFFAEINDHRGIMLTTQKDASDAAATLKKTSDADVKAFQQRTDEILRQNEKLQTDIQVHLGKAVGVGLFSTFETRRKEARNFAAIWAGLLILVTLGAAGTAMWLAKEFASGKTSGGVLLARLLVAIPVGFLITFLARQYSRNKHAEDEYAFKASISVSLNSFRELIERMRKEDCSAEIAFVEEYIREIFDNPTKRLYPAFTPAPEIEVTNGAGDVDRPRRHTGEAQSNGAPSTTGAGRKSSTDPQAPDEGES